MPRLSSLPQSLTDVHARLISYAPAANEVFYGFTGGGVRLDINANITAYVLDQDGVPVAGAPVFNVRPDGQYEVILTGGNGSAQFFMGPGSKFWPPTPGPHTVFVGPDQNTARPIGDQVTSLGLPEGHHAEFTISFRAMTTTAPMPPPTGGGGIAPMPVGGSVADAIAHLEAALQILRGGR